MTTISIRNYRAIDRADIELGGITLVAGDVGYGKSSVCTAIAAVLSGRGIVWPDVLKKDSKVLIRRGTDKGSITASGEGAKEGESGWQRTIDYPGGSVTTKGNAVTIDPIAAGLASLATVPLKERPLWLEDFLPGDPSEEDFDAAARDAGLSDENTKRAWIKVVDDGWDKTLKSAQDRAPQIKARWSEVTGEPRWGSAKGAGWEPEGMTEELKSATPSLLAEVQTQAQTRYDEVVAEAAVDAQQMRELAERASRLPGLESTSSKVGEEMSDADKILVQARKALEAYPDMMGAYGRDHCPHCGAEIAIRYWEEKGKSGGGVLKHNLAVEIPAEENDPEIKRHKRDAVIAVSDAEQVVSNLQGQVNEIEAQIETASAAKISLEQAEAKPMEGAPDITQAREDLEAARADVLRLDRYNRSGKLHGLITLNATVIDLLKPEGVRGQVLARSLKVFNREHLAPIIDSTSKDPAARWSEIEIRPDFVVTWNGYPYALVSRSQQWRVRAVLAIALAKASGQQAVVLDDADVLPSLERNQLFRALLASGIPNVIIGCMETHEDRLPPLAKKGLGRVYWFDTEGVCREVG